MINRPKWGIYRRADKTDPTVPDAKIYLADMALYKSAVNVSSSNLAYNKKAYNVGPVSGNAFQTANAKAERLVDGVQIDPVKYTNLTVPQATYNALGILSWIGTESSKKGNVVIDLGKPMDFNQLKVTAKTDRATSNPYTLTGLDPGATYKLSVRNVYTDPQSFKLMTSAESEIKTLQTSGDPIVPNPPSSVTATAASDKSINVNWEETSDAQSYRVALATDAYERTVADNVKGASFSIRDLSPGTTYKVKVYTIRRGIVSAVAAESQVTTAGIKHPSDNLLFNKEVQYTRVWNDDVGSYGAHRALDNNTDSRWVALKGSRTAWMMVDIGEITPVSTLEYYSFQNRLKKVSFYYATDVEAFKDPNSDKWVKILTDDRVAQGKFGNPAITKIEEHPSRAIFA